MSVMVKSFGTLNLKGREGVLSMHAISLDAREDFGRSPGGLEVECIRAHLKSELCASR